MQTLCLLSTYTHTHTHTQPLWCVQRHVSQHTLTQQREYMTKPGISVPVCANEGMCAFEQGRWTVCVCVCVCVCAFRKRGDGQCAFARVCVCAHSEKDSWILGCARAFKAVTSVTAEVQTPTQVLWEFLLQTKQEAVAAGEFFLGGGAV